jgi:signal transduction histidine kinase
LAAADPAREEILRQIQDRFPPVWDSPLPAARVIRTGEVILAPTVDPTWLKKYTGDDDYGPLAAAIGLRSSLVVPLIADGRILGALSFGGATPDQFGPSDVAVATELASRAAYAVDHARLYAASREAVDARDRFLSIAAHELRTPVAVMKAFAELLEREQTRGTLTPARTSHLISRIVSGANRLDHLTSEVLDVARSHLGQLPLRPRPFDLVKLVQEIVERHQERVVESHEVFVDAGESSPIVADPERIEQVLINLIENALKYSPAGGTVRVTVEPDAGGVRVSVIDDGIGLPLGAAEDIFSPFERAANASERGIPGIGLGLYIGRSFVERHGGRIWAESAGEDQGTAVTFWLPGNSTTSD